MNRYSTFLYFVHLTHREREKSKKAQGLAYLLQDPAAKGLIPSIPEVFSNKRIVNVAEVNQWRCLEESGQWLENVAQTYLVLASGKLFLLVIEPRAAASLSKHSTLCHHH